MNNIYVAGVVEEFHSDADMGYVCEFLMDVIEDNRYTNYDKQTGVGDVKFEKNMIHFIYGVGQ